MKRIMLILTVCSLSLALYGCSEDTPLQPGETGAASDEVDLDSSTVLDKARTDEGAGVAASVRSYEIIVENLTPATGDGASQPFSPPILATHNGGMHIFRERTYASSELAQVAQDAVGGPLIAKLEGSSRVRDVVAGDGVILPGGDARFEISTGGGMKKLSLVFMLVNTNDAFGGLDGVKLPMWGEKTYHVRAYDAGSELNTESAADIPGPCCGSPGMGTPEHMRIKGHRGIVGDGDLDPDLYGWDGPVARVTVRRLDPVYLVTLENLTPETVPGGSQVFSPPLLAAHRPAVGMFRVGHHATEAMALIAEDGDRSAMIEMLEGSPKVTDLVAADGPLLPGGMASWEITAGHRADRLSMACMLVNTNDAFSGVDRLRLPAGGSRAWHLKAYDAGSEQNTELASDIPGPCCGSPGAGTDEHVRIRCHAGIMGVGDLDPAEYGWDEPVAKLTVMRVK